MPAATVSPSVTRLPLDRRSPGRPRNPSLEQAILLAAVELISECGYAGTTVDAIGARAGVSKPTIYRRWPGGKAELITTAVTELRDELTPPIDTGSLRGDLLEMVGQTIGGLQLHARLAAGLTQQLRDSPELAAIVHERVITADRNVFAAIVHAAIARGELTGPPQDQTLLADLGSALVHFRLLVSGDAMSERLAAQIVDGVLLPALRSADRPDDPR